MTDWCGEDADAWKGDGEVLFYQVGETLWDVTAHPMGRMAWEVLQCAAWSFEATDPWRPRARWVSDR